MYIWLVQSKDADFATMAILPWFVPTESPQIIIDKLRIRLRRPTTFCAIAIEDDKTQGVLIAYISRMSPHVFLWQAHARRGFRFSRMMLEGLKAWTRTKGLRQIRLSASDERNRKLYERRYGFVRDGEEMYCNVA